MAKQLNILSSGQIVTTALHMEVQRSYLEYAMSVIVGRAIPDVRDGLKPVHRRILYAMHELGLTPDRPYRKCARVVGDVLGKYHPHGDQAVYDALVRMVQTFPSRYPLLDGHGNFGSVDNDPPAAMRYTESRLAPIGHEALLSHIGEATVDFIGNFDNSQQEPTVLPAQLPILVLNGCSGIAVGMATNIPPHNLGEVVDGLIALIDHPQLSDEDLMALIPGPDFPTGGEIVGTDGIREAYTTGRGSIPLRGVAQMEEIAGGRGRQRRTAIVVTELPYQVNKAGWIEKVADLVTQGRLEGISDIRDESDRQGMRVVIELKRDINPQTILGRLYKLTPLQTNFGAIFLTLADGQPRQMPLREVLQEFLSFRETTLMRQYGHELEQVERRLHILEGLLEALMNLDDVIDILRHAADGTSAKVGLESRLALSDRQADAILAMPLRRLTGLERQNLQDEYDTLTQRQQDLRRLLGDRRELLKTLKKDLRTLKRTYNDPRRTRIQSNAEQAEESQQLAELQAQAVAVVEETVLELTQRGYVRRLSPKAFQRQPIKQESSATLTEMSEDSPLQIHSTTTQHSLLLFTQSGKAYTVSVGDIPPTPRNAKGTPAVTLLPNNAQDSQDDLVAQLVMPLEVENWDVVMLTQQGRIKRLPLSEFTNITGRGLTALKLKEGDRLQHVVLTQPDQQLILATSNGRVVRYSIDDDTLPPQSRTAQGQLALRLLRNEHIVGCIGVVNQDAFLLVSSQGYGKRMQVNSLRLSKPGGLGLQAMPFNTKTDTLTGIISVLPGTMIMLFSSDQRVAQIGVDVIPLQDKDGKGDRLVKLGKRETITELAIASINLNSKSDTAHAQPSGGE